MNRNRSDSPPHLREQPPTWPRREPDRGARSHSRQREPEVYEESSAHELYPGATAMEDLLQTGDELGRLRILGRYIVTRLLVLSCAGWLGGAKLRVERRVALEHLALLPQHDWERLALERLCVLCRETPAPAIVPAAIVAAEAAAKRGHGFGAFALYRATYELARNRGWWAAAATAARGIVRLARLDEARYSERLWERRARVLDRRVARLDAAASVAAAHAGRAAAAAARR